MAGRHTPEGMLALRVNEAVGRADSTLEMPIVHPRSSRLIPMLAGLGLLVMVSIGLICAMMSSGGAPKRVPAAIAAPTTATVRIADVGNPAFTPSPSKSPTKHPAPPPVIVNGNTAQPDPTHSTKKHTATPVKPPVQTLPTTPTPTWPHPHPHPRPTPSPTPTTSKSVSASPSPSPTTTTKGSTTPTPTTS